MIWEQFHLTTEIRLSNIYVLPNICVRLLQPLALPRATHSLLTLSNVSHQCNALGSRIFGIISYLQLVIPHSRKTKALAGINCLFPSSDLPNYKDELKKGSALSSGQLVALMYVLFCGMGEEVGRIFQPD